MFEEILRQAGIAVMVGIFVVMYAITIYKTYF